MQLRTPPHSRECKTRVVGRVDGRLCGTPLIALRSVCRRAVRSPCPRPSDHGAGRAASEHVRQFSAPRGARSFSCPSQGETFPAARPWPGSAGGETVAPARAPFPVKRVSPRTAHGRMSQHASSTPLARAPPSSSTQLRGRSGGHPRTTSPRAHAQPGGARRARASLRGCRKLEAPASVPRETETCEQHGESVSTADLSARDAAVALGRAYGAADLWSHACYEGSAHAQRPPGQLPRASRKSIARAPLPFHVKRGRPDGPRAGPGRSASSAPRAQALP